MTLVVTVVRPSGAVAPGTHRLYIPLPLRPISLTSRSLVSMTLGDVLPVARCKLLLITAMPASCCSAGRRW